MNLWKNEIIRKDQLKRIHRHLDIKMPISLGHEKNLWINFQIGIC